ncbi:aminopeptidase P family protein [Kordiimonas lipolytica]|uniref:Aminopeptidase P family protein n=1 Tax=Kordiimonas lipolytica TaxID=1662421 RepID=A0ABV8U661_9PROT|nr:aminopeptidase P family protein [Kordiimonas lipolytica]
MSDHAARLTALRAELKERGLDGFIVPLTDEHMSEYVGTYAQRLPWLTNFTGSAGNAAVLQDKASLFIDGRYTIQAAAELDPALYEHHLFENYPLLKWVADNAPEHGVIGYDPELTTIAWVEQAEAALKKKGLKLEAVSTNPIDAIWEDRPAEPLAPALVHTAEHAGKSAEEKRAEIGEKLREEGADAAVITMLDSIAWAFNIRGTDVSNTPVTHAWGILHADGSANLYIAPEKVTDELRVHLGNQVQIEPRNTFYTALAALGGAGRKILADRDTNNAKVFNTLQVSGATIVEGQDPCILPKAVKNPTEQQGSRDAHIRDGAAIAEFLHWIETEAPKGGIDELIAVDKLWACRKKRDLLRDKSFDTISGSGPNGALPHYRVNEASNRPLKNGELYLVDSGGQYLDGTTDITRTVPVGDPTDEMRDRFTRVLKGHIALATTRFPKGTSGMALDAIARRPIWEAGLDYDHGTGHGVGAFLGVHEGPQRIAKGGTSVPLQPGMILSNEPAYYKENAFGIRIENLILVKRVEEDTEREMYEFENLTWAPIDRRLVDTKIMSDTELDWLNRYHTQVYDKIADLVDADTREWLKEATAPIERAA